MSVRFEGGAELSRALAGLSQRVSKSIVKEVLMDVAEPMRASAARLAPREPGAPDIADNIVVAAQRSKAGRTSETTVAYGPAKGFFYGYYQEWGTSRHGAQPFMRPSFDAGTAKALSEISRRLWVELAGRGINPSMRTGGGGLDDSFGSSSSGLGAGNVQRKGGTGL